MLLTIEDCHCVDECEQLLSTLQGLTDEEYGRLADLDPEEYFFRSAIIEDCKAVILFFREANRDGIPFKEIKLLFYLRHCPTFFSNRICLAVEQQFKAVTSASAIFEEYEARKNASKQKTELPKTQKK